MRCMDCDNLEYVDIGKKKKVRKCKVGNTTIHGWFHYCKDFNDNSIYITLNNKIEKLGRY